MSVLTARSALAVCSAVAMGLLSGCAAGQLPAADRCDPAVGAALSPAPVAFAPVLPVDPTAAPAASLRSGLELLLREHVDLLSYDTAAGLAPGSGANHSRGAATVLRENTSAISFALAGCDPGARGSIRQAWTDRTNTLWRYGNDVHHGKSVVAVRRSLATLDERVAGLLARRFDADVALTRRQLTGESALLVGVLDRIGRGDPGWPTAAEQAADATEPMATSWAEALARQEHLPDSADGEPARLRAELTGLLVRPVGAMVLAAQASSGTQPHTSAALTQASALLADSSQRAWSSGPGGSQQPGRAADSAIWRQAGQQLVSFATGVVLGRPAAELRPVVEALAQTDEQLALAFSRTHPGTGAAAVAASLAGPTHALWVAIRDAVTHAPTAAWDIAASDDGFAGLAAVLAKAVSDGGPVG